MALVKLLLDSKADPNLYRPLNVAVSYPGIPSALVQVLLDAKATPNFDIEAERDRRKVEWFEWEDDQRMKWHENERINNLRETRRLELLGISVTDTSLYHKKEVARGKVAAANSSKNINNNTQVSTR